MQSDRYNNKYRVSSSRAPWHNYNAGMYFVTICTKNRVHYFGEIGCPHVETFPETSAKGAFPETSVKGTFSKRSAKGAFPETSAQFVSDPQMQFSEIGRCADEQLRNIATHYLYAEIPLWVVMPDHIHAVVVINHDKIPHERRDVEQWYAGNAVETRCSTSLQQPTYGRAHDHQNIANMQGWLSVVIGGIKRAVTRFANENHLPFAWQPRFYDSIIRDSDELNRVTEYIKNNVSRWYYDGHHPVKTSPETSHR